MTRPTFPPEPSFSERVRVMCRHLDLMIEVFGEELGCRMFRKVAPWYAKRFGPCHEFNKRVVQISTRAEFHEVLENYIRWRRQFLDETGELLPRFRPPPMVASFMREPASRRATNSRAERAGGSLVTAEFSIILFSRLANAAFHRQIFGKLN